MTEAMAGGPGDVKSVPPIVVAPSTPVSAPMAAPIVEAKAPVVPAPVANPVAPIPPAVYTPPIVMAPSLREEKFEDLIYSDAEKAKQLLKNEILGEIQARDENKNRQVTFWEQFYSKNSDLKAHKRVVDLVMKEKLPEFKDLPVEEGKEKLASEVRGILSSIRAQSGATETELPSGTVPTIPASGAPMSTGGGRVVPQGPKSFVDQLSNLRSKKGRLN